MIIIIGVFFKEGREDDESYEEKAKRILRAIASYISTEKQFREKLEDVSKIFEEDEIKEINDDFLKKYIKEQW